MTETKKTATLPGKKGVIRKLKTFLPKSRSAKELIPQIFSLANLNLHKEKDSHLSFPSDPAGRDPGD